jgi:multidrug resistance efflux pump
MTDTKDESSSYEPIPVPPRLLWREFKLRYLPVFVFAIVLLAALILWRARLGPASVLGEAENLRAEVSASQPGILSELKVRSFQQVKAGEVLGKIVGADPKNAANLVSPIDGSVTYLFHQPGDRVLPGEPVIIVSGNQPDRIVAYLRQPVGFEPAEGMAASVRARARHSQEGAAKVVKVSPQLAPIPATLLPGRESLSEMGLPVILSVPEGMRLYPGEIVEVKIYTAAGPAGPAPAPAPATTPASAPTTNAATTAAR